MTETLNDSIRACNHFFYFAMNYPHDFIQQCWADQQWLADHLQAKFDGLYERYKAMGVMNAFYAELDGNNRVKFLTWIMTECRQNFGTGLPALIEDD